MKKVCAYAPAVAVAVAGCATASMQHSMQYSGYDCAQIVAEQQRMYTRASDLASLGDTGAPEAEYARLREEFEALREAGTMKNCGKKLVPSLRQAKPDASAAQGGTRPRIAPPEAPFE